MEKLNKIWMYLSLWRVLPVYFFFRRNRFSEKCGKDLGAWASFRPMLRGRSRFWQFAYLIVNEKVYRNVMLNRLKRNAVMYLITRVLFPPLHSCYINMPPEKIGGGLVFQHGFSTIVSANEIGENCRIYQQVTIGYHGPDSPVIGRNCIISAGAIVIGGVHVGDNTRVGAGAVVTHDVADNETVVGVPARPICRHGKGSDSGQQI